MSNISIFNYKINNSSTTDRLDVYIDGIIVDAETQEFYKKYWDDETSISFKSVRDEVIASGKKNITFWVNSYGGHVGDAMAIHDWIQELENKDYNISTKGIGMVCSAATYIVSASKKSTISKNSWYMIHNVSGKISGDVNTVENYAKSLRKFNNAIVDFYSELTSKPKEEISDLMGAETWYTGTEAVANGFVKTLSNEQNFTNSIDASKFPFQNVHALNAYNSFCNKDNKHNNKDFNIDMNKLVTAIVNAFKSNKLIVKEGEQANLTEETLTNALESAFKEVNLSDMVNEAIDEKFKDGLPDDIHKSLTNLISDSLKDVNKDFISIESYTDLKNKYSDLEKELEKIKQDYINNIGGVAVKKDNVDDKFDHPGIKID